MEKIDRWNRKKKNEAEKVFCEKVLVVGNFSIILTEDKSKRESLFSERDFRGRWREDFVAV